MHENNPCFASIIRITLPANAFKGVPAFEQHVVCLIAVQLAGWAWIGHKFNAPQGIGTLGARRFYLVQ